MNIETKRVEAMLSATEEIESAENSEKTKWHIHQRLVSKMQERIIILRYEDR
jgi:hypothetical protein